MIIMLVRYYKRVIRASYRVVLCQVSYIGVPTSVVMATPSTDIIITITGIHLLYYY